MKLKKSLVLLPVLAFSSANAQTMAEMKPVIDKFGGLLPIVGAVGLAVILVYAAIKGWQLARAAMTRT